MPTNFFSKILKQILRVIAFRTDSYWKSLKQLMTNYKEVDSIPILKQTINDNDELYVTNEEKANCLNDYFTSVSTLDDSNSQLPPLDLKTQTIFDNIEIQISDTEHLIGILDTNKAVGPDLISHKVL